MTVIIHLTLSIRHYLLTMSGELLPLGVDIDGGKVRRLIHGGSVRLHPSAIGSGPHKVYLTKAQYKGAGVAVHRGRHMTMRMSPEQVAYNVKHGSGIFGNIWNGIKNAVSANKGTLINAAKSVASNLVPKALNAAQSYATQKLPQYASQIGAVRNVAQNAINSKLNGGKVRKVRSHSKAGSSKAKYLFGNTDEIEHNLHLQTGGGARKSKKRAPSKKRVQSYAGDSSELTHNLSLRGDPVAAALFASDRPLSTLRRA